jgi:hypothetical protein
MPEYPDITAIGAGHNLDIGDLTLITALVEDDINSLPVLTPAKYRRGEKRVRANGAPDRSGNAIKRLTSGLMTLAQYEYVIDTFEGPVTIYSWLTLTTPILYNAYLDMGDQDDYEPVNTTRWGWCLKDVVWQLTKVQVIP